jgi:DNA replication protein DnaC
MKAQLDAELDTPDGPWLERLWRLIDYQVRARRERAIERRVGAARFPVHKTLDTFDFDFQTGVDRDQILSLATLRWLDSRQSIL